MSQQEPRSSVNLTRRRQLRLGILLLILAVLTLGFVPLMALWPEKPDWPSPMAFLTVYILPVILAAIPAMAARAVFKSMRQDSSHNEQQ